MIRNYRVWAQDGDDADPALVFQVLATSHADALAETISAKWLDDRLAALVRARSPERKTVDLPGGCKLVAIETPPGLAAVVLNEEDSHVNA